MKKKLVIVLILLGSFLFLLNFYISKQAKIKKEQEIFLVAKEYVKENSVYGMEFDLKILKQLDKWALVEVIPVNPPTDKAAVVLEKVGEQWVARAFGTIFPEWEKKVPELFK